MSVMARKGERKLFLFGRYSLALLLPKKWLSDLGALRGDAVSMEYDRARRRIVLRFDSDNSEVNVKATAKPKTTAKQVKPAALELISKNEATDLQPIPEL